MEPVTIHIPDTIEEAGARLAQIAQGEEQRESQRAVLDRLDSVEGWERAAIVFAFTYEPGRGQRRHLVDDRKSEQYTARQFSELGYPGLAHERSVSRLRQAWKGAISAGDAKDVLPGDSIDLPDRPMPAVFVQRSIRDNFNDNVPPEQKYEAVQEVLRRAPQVAERIENDFIQKAGRDPGLAARIDRVYEEHHPVPEPRDRAFGDMERQRLFGFGVAIYSAIQREQDRVAGLLGYLESHGVDERDREAVDRLIESLAKSRQLLVDIEDRVNKAAGNDYDEVFRRLVNG